MATAALGLALVAATACGDDGRAGPPPPTDPGEAIEALLDEAAEEVDDLGDPARTSSVPPTTADPDGEGLDHRKVALRVLGDDPALDELAVACFDADLSACDGLYVASPDGSLYQAYGATCGARLDEPTNLLCVDVLVGAGDDPAGLGGDPFLDELARQCAAGDLLDCDLLFAEADRSSAYEAYGASCAGRISPQDERDCTELLE